MKKELLFIFSLLGYLYSGNHSAYGQSTGASTPGSQVSGTYHIFRMTVNKGDKVINDVLLPSIKGADTLSVKIVAVQKTVNQVTCSVSQSKNSTVFLSFLLGDITLKPTATGYNFYLDGISEIGQTDGKRFFVEFSKVDKETGVKTHVSYEGRKE